MKLHFIVLLYISAASLTSISQSAEISSSEEISQYNSHIKPLIQKYCFDCHGPEKDKGDVRFDNINPDIVSGEDGLTWKDALDQMNSGEMPPEKEKQPTLRERETIANWLNSQFQKAISAKALTQKHTAIRRMTRYELKYALEDILQLPIDVSELPEETASEQTGMKNAVNHLKLGGPQLEASMEIVIRAIDRATHRLNDEMTFTGVPQILEEIAPDETTRKAPAVTLTAQQKKEIARKKKEHNALVQAQKDKALEEQKQREKWLASLTPQERSAEIIAARKKRAAAKAAAAAEVKKLSPEEQKNLAIAEAERKAKQRQQKEDGQRKKEVSKLLQPHKEGFLMKEKSVAVFRINTLESREGRFQLQLKASASKNTPLNISAGYIIPGRRMIKRPLKSPEIQAGESKVYMIEGQLEDVPYQNVNELVFWIEDKVRSSEVYVESFNFTGPLSDDYEQRLFFTTDDSQIGNLNAKEFLQFYAERAYRRPLESQELDEILKVYASVLDRETGNKANSLVKTLSHILCSPKFFYLGFSESYGRDFQLAENLSFFLWCSIPDRQLYDLAKKGTLHKEDVLKAQVERMLEDDRSKRLVENFSDQWLGTQDIYAVAVDNTYYENFSREVHMPLMRQETIESVNDVFRNGASALSLLQSNHVFVNDKLASHYGIEGVVGSHFRKVKLDSDSSRGGLLTQGAFLVSNSDGKSSHAIKRGMWLVKNILNDPPPPPPKIVPDLDDTIPGFDSLSLNQKLAKHRESAACVNCHKKIDPWGLLFESFDASGAFRDTVLVKPKAAGVKIVKGIEKKKMVPAVFAEVDASARIPDGAEIDGTSQLKAYLLRHKKEQFAEGLTEKLLSYALSRDQTFYDSETITNINQNFIASDYSVKKLIWEIVNCENFKGNQ